MIKSKTHVPTLCLSFLMLYIFIKNTQAIPIGGITNILKGLESFKDYIFGFRKFILPVNK